MSDFSLKLVITNIKLELLPSKFVELQCNPKMSQNFVYILEY